MQSSINKRIVLAGRLALCIAVAGSAASLANAHGFKCGDVSVGHPYSRATIPGARNGAVYFKSLKNEGREPDQLVSARTAVSASVELHQMTMDGNVMRMRALPVVEVPAGADVNFRHGQANGHHLMLVDVVRPLKEGERFPVTLKFSRAGECVVEAWVEGGATQEHKH